MAEKPSVLGKTTDSLRLHPWEALAGLIVIVALVILFVLWVVLDPSTVQEKTELIKAVAQIAGGALIFVSVIAAWKRIEVAHEDQAIAREGQITERFTRAIDQLGNEVSIDVRLGGIYALESIARDSEKDHCPIMEVLSAYVRRKARWKGELAEKVDPYEEPPDLEPDVQAVLTVMGRRERTYERGKGKSWLDLSKTDLRKADLAGTCLEGVFMWYVHLEWASLIEAHLKGTELRYAHFEVAILDRAHLEMANLTNTYLAEADLKETHLEGADLSEAIGLTQDQIDSAIGDEDTKLPEGLQMPQHWLGEAQKSGEEEAPQEET